MWNTPPHTRATAPPPPTPLAAGEAAGQRVQGLQQTDGKNEQQTEQETERERALKEMEFLEKWARQSVLSRDPRGGEKTRKKQK